MPRSFLFVPEGHSAPAGAISCDGLVPGSALDLSHWRGNHTPRELKADTSTEIALAFIDSSLDGDHPDAVIVNNHFDTDGLLSVWTLLHPGLARPRRGIMTAAAEVGDFDAWPNDERGILIDAAILSLRAQLDDDAKAYPAIFPRLVDLLDHVDAFPDLWRPTWNALQRGRQDVADGRIEVATLGNVGIVRHTPHVDEIPGPLLSKLLHTSCWRCLLVFTEPDGRFRYRYELPRHAWADTVVRMPLERPDGASVVDALGEGWTTADLPGLTSIAATTTPTTLDPVAVLQRIRGVDAEAHAALS